jgi:hypothetical protein
MSKVRCSRCAGTGNVPSFAHVQGGVCFRCNGTGLSYPDKPQPINLEEVSHIYTLVKIENGISYYAQFYVWDKEPRAEMYGKGRFFSRGIVRGTHYAEPLLTVEPQLWEAPLADIRTKYKEYLAKGYAVLPSGEFHKWFEDNIELYEDQG